MSLQLLPSVAARELQTRRTIRQSLIEWCRLCGFEPAAHHLINIAELEAVARGECDRLAIFLPPGSAKSTYASVLFPPWLLATSPESAIIAASHTQELAERWGRKVRNLIAEARCVCGDHRSHSGGRQVTSKEAAAYGEAAS